MTNRRSYTCAAFAIAGLTVSLTSPAQELVTNASFEDTTANQSIQVSSGRLECCGGGPYLPGGIPYGQYATGWYASGLVLLYMPGAGVSGTTADTTGALSQFGPDSNLPAFVQAHPSRVALWGPGNPNPPAYNPNGLTLSPDGGNFLALDGDHVAGGPTPQGPGQLQGQITQSLGNLHVGDRYDVSFYWASAQQWSFDGDVETQMRVSLCAPGQMPPPASSVPFQTSPSGCSQFTGVLNSGNHGFKGWEHPTFAFTATSSNEVLGFLALGKPQGLPPIALLDGVSVKQAPTGVPEPGTGSLLLIGLAAMAGVAYQRRKRRGSA